MDVVTFLVILVVVLWAYILWTRRKYYALAWKIPGPLGLPLIGITHKIYDVRELLYTLVGYTIKYKKKTLVSWIGPWPGIYTIEPSTAEIFLNSPNCINKSIIYNAFNDLMNDGLLVSKSPRWNKHRKLISPSFRQNVLLNFFPNFNKIADKLCDRIHTNLDFGKANLRTLLFETTLETAVLTTTGLEADKEKINTITRCYERILDMSVERMMNPLLRSGTIYHKTKLYKSFMSYRNVLRKMFEDPILEKIKSLDSNNTMREDSFTEDDCEGGTRKPKNIFVDQAIDVYRRNQFTFEDILTETGMLLFAAYETTATSLFSTIMCLAMHPQYQERAFNEIRNTFPDNNFDVEFEDFKNLVYLEMCINETLRIVPPIPLIARSCTGDVKLSDDIVIPKGTELVIDIFNMQRDKDIWGPNAHVFNPDNFLPANLVDKHKYAYIPFSKGPRNCIGWQYSGMFLKVMLAKILSKYKFTTNSKLEDLRFVEHISMKLKEYPILEAQRR